MSYSALILLLLFGSAAFAQTEDAPAPIADEAPNPVKHRRAPQRTETFARSKFTSDRSEAEADKRSLLLSLGIDKIIDLDADFKISDRPGAIMTGNTTIVTVVPASIGDQKQLIIKPIGAGETNVTVRDKSGKVKIIFDITVANQNLVRYLARLTDKLREVEGITLAIEDQKIVIRGDVLSPNDYGTIVNEIGDKSYGEAIVNKATMSNVTLTALAKKIEADLQQIAQTIRTRVLNGKIILDGTADSEAVKTRALRRAEWYLPTVKISDPIASASNAEKSDKPLQIIQSDIQVVPPQPKRESKLVRLSVYFVELSKDFLKNFGFKWQPGFTADPSISIGATIGPGPLFLENPASDTWNQGVSFHYTSKLALYPWSRDHQSIVMDLTSDSWSVKEESKSDCTDTLKKVKQQLSDGGVPSAVVEWDNGGQDGCT